MMQQQQPGVFVVNTQTKRETGRKAQLSNIAAAKAIADVIRTSLGPRAMLKMMLDPMGGIAITNDGNAILREIDVQHPAAKSVIELARSQDESVGDGTTSVAILAGELLVVAVPYLEKNIHAIMIIRGYARALHDALEHLRAISFELDVGNRDVMLGMIRSCIGTKFISRWSDLMCSMALDAVRTVCVVENGRKDIDIKKFIRIEKIPGDELAHSYVLDGVVLNKDVTHAKMPRRVEKPRILLLDCTLEYKKGESKTDLEITKAEDWTAVLRQEEEHIQALCTEILKFKPDVVVTEKGISDLAQHYLVKAGVAAFRRLRKPDNLRLARASGGRIVHRVDEITESDIGTGCGLMEVRKIGDDYFAFFEKCRDPKACTIVLRGANKDLLNEVERNLQDALCVARNITLEPRALVGGGAAEMSTSVRLTQLSRSIESVEQWPYRAVAIALEVIPRTLAENCGANSVRVLTELRTKHSTDGLANAHWGVDGIRGKAADMKAKGIVEPLEVKLQTIKAAVEGAMSLLRVDDIVAAAGKQKKGPEGPDPEEMAMAE